MDKALQVKIIQKGEPLVDDECYQSVTCEEVPSVSYWVSDFTFNPEDARIGRDLVSAKDYLNILHLGMILGQKGYNRIDAVYEEDDE